MVDILQTIFLNQFHEWLLMHFDANLPVISSWGSKWQEPEWLTHYSFSTNRNGPTFKVVGRSRNEDFM